MQEMHNRSIYKGRAEPKETRTKALFFNCIKKIGNPYPGGTSFFVAVDEENQVCGFIVGVLDTVYQISDKLTATDIFFYTTLTAKPLSASMLLDAFLKWAENVPGVVEIMLGITNAIKDYKNTEKLYKRKGLTQCGVFYEKRISNHV
jgi:hypothetical protein